MPKHAKQTPQRRATKSVQPSGDTIIRDGIAKLLADLGARLEVAKGASFSHPTKLDRRSAGLKSKSSDTTGEARLKARLSMTDPTYACGGAITISNRLRRET